MSGSPGNLPADLPRVTAANQPIAPTADKKRGCGCFGSVSGAILFILAISLLLNPWAVRIGGRWTPALTWHGVGKLRSSSGANYGLFLELSFNMPGRRSRGKNLQGKAMICTPQGDIYPLNVDGYLKRAWLDTDGKPVTFYLSSVPNAQPKLKFELLGSWQVQELILDDKGSMAMSFARDGNAKGYLQGSNAPQESATITLHYATQDEFSSVCAQKQNVF